MNSTHLFSGLWQDFDGEKSLLVWPGEGSFEVVVGAILVQNTAWKNVEKALQNLRTKEALNLEAILKMSSEELALAIKPSGFYNTKAKRLHTLCRAIKSEFKNFENFKTSVSREWLLSIKGVGAETCDAILAYACGHAVMVVDAYVLRILNHLGYEFESYDEAQEWLMDIDVVKISELVSNANEAEIFKIYHALVLEFCKKHFKGKLLSDVGRERLRF
ncbi:MULTISPECIES: endonuclease III domain-containing protein [unclassified Campylobacter]|uniref:endonuclease III domain-containing protein n=1 Tax=unclassified Campylobacter TaxID=2593542 RepID=UPI003D349FE7